jgi:hypothetical protein
VFPRRLIIEGRRFGTLSLPSSKAVIVVYPAFEDGTDRGFRNVGLSNNQTPGKHPKDYTQDAKQGESLKSRTHTFLKLLFNSTPPQFPHIEIPSIPDFSYISCFLVFIIFLILPATEIVLSVGQKIYQT